MADFERECLLRSFADLARSSNVVRIREDMVLNETGGAAVLAAISAMLPTALHLGALRGAPLRPFARAQKIGLERLLFRYLLLLMAVNGLLIGSTVFFGKMGDLAPAVVSGSLAVPTLMAQLVCLVIAKWRDLAASAQGASKAGSTL
jgi:cation transporter-like permease